MASVVRRAMELAHIEPGEPSWLLVVDLDPFDLRAAWPLPAEVDEPLNRVGLALEDGFDGAVPVVPHPAGHAVLEREAVSSVAEEHALDMTVDDDTPAHVPSLVEELARARIGATFNQYAAHPHLRERLRAYLKARRDARVLLVGEAAGYRGARVSGLPFTSERQLTGTGPAEASATIVQTTLAELGVAEDVLLWNVVPTHPGTETSNRRPTRGEVVGGLSFLEPLTRGRRVIAVGRLAQEATGAPYVRHPSRGGARAFRAGLLELLRG
jgi:uracil-DNA glycosylase